MVPLSAERPVGELRRVRREGLEAAPKVSTRMMAEEEVEEAAEARRLWEAEMD